ncbi:MAG TPA: hypothetical protein VLC93_04535 [Myxococcota bacterium]|nr:hypothetical protein [Myxococcota bacterium]
MRAKLDAANTVLHELDVRAANAVPVTERAATPSESQRAEERAELLAYVEGVYKEAIEMAVRLPAVSSDQEREQVRRITVRATVAALELDWRSALRERTEDTHPHAERLLRQRAATEFAPSHERNDTSVDEARPRETYRRARLTKWGTRLVVVLLIGVLIPSSIWLLSSRGQALESPEAPVSANVVVLEPIEMPVEPPAAPTPTTTTDPTPQSAPTLVKQTKPRRQRVSTRPRRNRNRARSTTIASGKTFQRS